MSSNSSDVSRCTAAGTHELEAGRANGSERPTRPWAAAQAATVARKCEPTSLPAPPMEARDAAAHASAFSPLVFASKIVPHGVCGFAEKRDTWIVDSMAAS